jgi:hypothetical protein
MRGKASKKLKINESVNEIVQHSCLLKASSCKFLRPSTVAVGQPLFKNYRKNPTLFEHSEFVGFQN